MDQVLNELSLCGHHNNIPDALDALNDIYKASRALEKLGFTKVIRTTENFTSLELATDYTCNDWLWDRNIPKEHRDISSIMRSRFSKAPYVEKLCENEGLHELQEYTFEDKKCFGLALAHLWDIPALSLAGPKYFDVSQVDIERATLDKCGKITTSNHSVFLAKNKNDVSSHEKVLKQKNFPLSSGEDLIKYSEHFFKNIILCPNVISQLEQFGKGYYLIDKLKTILEQLEIAIQDSHDNRKSFSPKGIVFTPTESETVQNNPKLRGKRTFLDNTGKTRICYPHVDITDGDRMHILPDIADCKVYIGYIGPHLPTKKY